MKFRFLIPVLFVLAACGSEEQTNPNIAEAKPKNKKSFVLKSAQETGVNFVNQIEETEEVNHLEWDAVYYGGGVAVGDLNNDLLPDLYFTGNQTRDRVYLNKGDFQFEDITESAGIDPEGLWSNGASMADVNGDGHLDIYVCRSSWKMDAKDPEKRKNKLYINQGNGTFVDEAEKWGVANIGYSTQAAFLDYDIDGDLDLFLLNAPSNNLDQKVAYASNGFPEFTSDKLYRNDYGQKFTDVSKEAGVDAFSFGLGVVCSDLNHDGKTDIYVANDYERPDYLYINQGDGTFKNSLNDMVKHTAFTAMGCESADLNNDGFVDLIVLDMQSPDHQRSKTNMPSMQPENFWSYVSKGYNYQYMSNVLQVNNGRGFFTDAAQWAGISSTDWSWAVLGFDADHDGLKDLYVSNGINRDIRNNDFALKFQERLDEGQSISLFDMVKETPVTELSNFFFLNHGDFRFSKEQKSLGLDQPSFSYGAAYSDLDGDGDLDLIVSNNNASPFIYENQVAEGNWLKVTTNAGAGNPQGFGSKAIAFYDGQMQYQECTPVRGYQASCEPVMHFGFGDESQLDSLLVLFADGSSIKKRNVQLNKAMQFNIAEAKKQPYSVYQFDKRVFEDYSAALGIKITHRENLFDDFEREILLPHKQSDIGPALAIADVNGDGLDDFFIGGAKGESGIFFMQNAQGRFTLGQPLAGSNYEDVDAAFFDADGDGDQDLVVASGGYESSDWKDYKHRLYLNDGSGAFVMASDKQFPFSGSNAGALQIWDVDQDGDLDVFIGGHVLPGLYPKHAKSYLYLNQGDNFTLKEVDAAAFGMGPISALSTSDIDGDGKDELLACGEWTAPAVVYYKENKLQAHPAGEQFKDLSGWWQSIDASDLNGDGVPDIVLGNIGDNNKFHVDEEHPLKIYGHDFDGNGTNDVVLSKKYKGGFVPVRGRECSSEQMPFVKEKFVDYQSFSEASIEEVLGDEMKDAVFYEVREFSSGVLMSNGSSWSFEPFGVHAQLSAVRSTLCADFSGDGFRDVLLAGNLFGAEVETTRHDASNGLFLASDGKGGFDQRRFLDSGFYAPGNVRELGVLMNTAIGRPIVLVVSNDGPMMAYVAPGIQQVNP